MPTKEQITVQAKNTRAATRQSFSNMCQKTGAVRSAQHFQEGGALAGDEAGAQGKGHNVVRHRERQATQAQGNCKTKMQEARQGQRRVMSHTWWCERFSEQTSVRWTLAEEFRFYTTVRRPPLKVFEQQCHGATHALARQICLSAMGYRWRQGDQT